MVISQKSKLIKICISAAVHGCHCLGNMAVLMHKVLTVLQSLVVCASLLFRFCRYGSRLVSTFLYKVVGFYIINICLISLKRSH